MKHLFVICPNNSGSTLLHNIIATSPNVAHLNYTEGQNISWKGPVPTLKGAGRVFTEIESDLGDPKMYNWKIIKKGWNKIWTKNNPEATVRLEKSPPNVCRAKILKDQFINPHFVIMVRNPYAQIQSCIKYIPDVSLERITKHALRCLQICADLSKNLKNSVSFNYEFLCGSPVDAADKILNFMPELENLTTNKLFHIHMQPGKPIKNMNQKHINNLSPDHFRIINPILEKDQSVMDYWGYQYEL